MGFFADIIASDARQSCGQVPVPAQQPAVVPPPVAPVTETDPPAAAPEAPAAQPVPAPEAASAPAPAAHVPEPSPAPAAASGPPEQPPEPPSIDLTADADAAEEAKRRQEHEAAEAKRKAEWDAKQAEKKKVRQEQLDRIKAMSDADLLTASVERVAADTEKLTRRNMKEAVCEHIQAKCREDAAFARLVMNPDKTMINCFQFINRKAREYAEQEMKDLGIERTGTYGIDIPDGACYSWSETYFRTEVKEDSQDEEKFVPKPYVPSTRKAPKAKAAKKKPEKKLAAENPKGAVPEQMSLI